MGDLIDRNAACRTLFEDCHIKNMGMNRWIRFEEAVKALNALPAAQMRQKTGHWTEQTMDSADPVFLRRWYCSACGGWQTYGEPPYCPMCGANMRGKEDG